jgi:hypothetical protein
VPVVWRGNNKASFVPKPQIELMSAANGQGHAGTTYGNGGAGSWGMCQLANYAKGESESTHCPNSQLKLEKRKVGGKSAFLKILK